GASTVRRLRCSRPLERVVTMRTAGKGRISGKLTGICCVTVPDRPAASVTRRETAWLPGVEKLVVCFCPPVAKADPSRFQAKPVIGLALSTEVETRETVSPTCGWLGNQLNAAVGPLAGAPGTASTNECAAEATFPASSAWRTRTV